MYDKSKKEGLLILSKLNKERIIAVCSFVVLFFAMFAGYSAYTTASQKVVVINPGHSVGYDSGATNGSVTEAAVNQALAGKIVKQLNSMGYKAYITHSSDPDMNSYKLLSNSDGNSLAKVTAAVNKINPDLAMSIHHNSGGSNASGYELYWSSYRDFDQVGVYEVSGLWNGDTAYRDSSPCAAAVGSRDFANVLNSKLSGMLPFRKIVERDDYLPAHAASPCVLYEGGFISNASEAAYLNSDAYQNDAANRICSAIDAYFGGSGASDVQAPTIQSVSTNVTETTSTQFTVTAVVTDNVGVSSVRFPVWTAANGQDDIKWYSAKNIGNNTWQYTVNISDHGNQTGIYNVHAYAYDSSGNSSGKVSGTVNVKMLTGVSNGITAKKTGSLTATAYVKGVTGSNFRFAVWSANGGQDDIVWSSAVKQTDGSYGLDISRANHNYDSGVYNIHCYSDSGFAGAATVDFGTMTAQTLTADSFDSNTMSFKVRLSGISAPNGLSAVYFPVWSTQNGQDDIVWYQGVKSGDDYILTVDLANHPGTDIAVHAYGTDSAGLQNFLGATTLKIPEGNVGASGVSLGSLVNGSFSVKASGLTSDYGIRNVFAAVWSEANGQDDIVWHRMTASGKDYLTNVALSSHKDSGTYQIHTYIEDNAGSMHLIDMRTMEVPGMSAQLVTGSSPVDGKFTLTAQGLTIPNGIRSVNVAVWTDAGGQDDLIWYTMGGADPFTASVNAQDHNNQAGTYVCHVYGYDNSGVPNFLGQVLVQVDAGQLVGAKVTTDSAIMGTGSANASQLAAMYNANSPIDFPQYYKDRGVDINTFAQMYIEEGAAEGVRADIAFGQAMHETGYLNFGGDVKIGQFNFAGLGATGNGVTGENFAAKYGDNATGIRMGIRAQIQHLKAYASTDALNNACVDSRFGYVTRGKAPTIGQLAGTWAADKSYGDKLVNIINKLY